MNKDKVGEGCHMYGLNKNAYMGFKRKDYGKRLLGGPGYA
jgi:hypothetical protein